VCRIATEQIKTVIVYPRKFLRTRSMHPRPCPPSGGFSCGILRARFWAPPNLSRRREEHRSRGISATLARFDAVGLWDSPSSLFSLLWEEWRGRGNEDRHLHVGNRIFGPARSRMRRRGLWGQGQRQCRAPSIRIVLCNEGAPPCVRRGRRGGGGGDFGGALRNSSEALLCCPAFPLPGVRALAHVRGVEGRRRLRLGCGRLRPARRQLRRRRPISGPLLRRNIGSEDKFKRDQGPEAGRGTC
jgi:hypothetical protein